ncbi:UNVERIFIED_CONTAM: hypothetical protein FKN15_007671 [Acipenser sinensis]
MVKIWGGQKNSSVRLSLPMVCFVWEIAMIILFGVFIRYNEETDSHWIETRKEKNISSDLENDFYFRYPSFQDVHVMIFVGFGFLMTFLQRYSFGAVGFNFLIAAFGIQWALLMQGWFHSLDWADGKIKIGIENMINADFCVASCLIAYGGVLGKVSPVQLMVMTLFGVTLFAIEEYIILTVLHVSLLLLLLSRTWLIKAFDFEGEFADRVPSVQGGYQAAGLCVALAFGIVGGTLVGFILKLNIWGDAPDENCFEDDVYWEVPEEDEENPPPHAALEYTNHMPNKLSEPAPPTPVRQAQDLKCRLIKPTTFHAAAQHSNQ